MYYLSVLSKVSEFVLSVQEYKNVFIHTCCVAVLISFVQLKEDIQVRSNEAQRESRKKEKLEKELKGTKNELESKTAELKTKQTNLQRAQEDILKLEQQLKEQRVSVVESIPILPWLLTL